jgi:hypothetical protein
MANLLAAPILSLPSSLPSFLPSNAIPLTSTAVSPTYRPAQLFRKCTQLTTAHLLASDFYAHASLTDHLDPRLWSSPFTNATNATTFEFFKKLSGTTLPPYACPSSNFLLVLAALAVAPRLWQPPALLLSPTPAPSSLPPMALLTPLAALLTFLLHTRPSFLPGKPTPVIKALYSILLVPPSFNLTFPIPPPSISL